MARPGEPCPRPVAEAIEHLRDQLFREYGLEFEFIVTGRGATLGASSRGHGVVEAVVREPLVGAKRFTRARDETGDETSVALRNYRSMYDDDGEPR